MSFSLNVIYIMLHFNYLLESFKYSITCIHVRITIVLDLIHLEVPLLGMSLCATVCYGISELRVVLHMYVVMRTN